MDTINSRVNDTATPCDRFGHPIDSSVGYARGKILASPLEESKRRQQAMRLIRNRALASGMGSFYNFTGLHRNYAVEADQIALAEEWTGQAVYWDELVELAREHFGGKAEHDVAVFNRATAGIVAACMALVKRESVVLSVTPGSRSHPSISRGATLAGAGLVEVSSLAKVEECLSRAQVSLIVVTGVSSELEVMDEDLLMQVIGRGSQRRIPTFIDDAYGARLRPIIYGQPRSLETGADLCITSCDKAGMDGPRAGLMAGRRDLLDRVLARASELGLEARAPLSLGVYGSLRKFDPEVLRREVQLGGRIHAQLSAHFGREKVRKLGLGATIPEDVAWELVQSVRQASGPLRVVPAEVTAGIGMYWLERYGIITVNALGQPGARVSLRFKPDPGELERFGGVPALIRAIEDGVRYVAERASSVEDMRRLILGD